MKEIDGLYYPNGSFRDRDEIRRKLLLQGTELPRPRYITSPPTTRTFDEWTKIVLRRQQERKEVLGIPESVEVEIDSEKPICLAMIPDVHAGGEDVNYHRFVRDVDIIRSIKAFAVTVGDLTDSFFFMPGVDEQLTSSEEEVLYVKSALGLLAEGGRLLAGWGGDHDLWGRDKMGAHSLYAEFYDRFGAYYLEGVSYLTIGLNNGERLVKYPFVGSHRHNGYSVYNDCHAALRQLRDEGIAPNSDHIISFTAHKHWKGSLTQIHKVHGGDEVCFHCLALGSYKESDRYSRKRGYPRKKEKSQGATAVILYPGEQKVDICWDMDEAMEKMTSLVS
jgi:hypothetical protein